MDKGIKKLKKHIESIEKDNRMIVDKVIKHTLKLKNRNLSTINTVNSHVSEFLVHKDTHNFPIVKQSLLNYLNEIHQMYPFICIAFDIDQTNGLHKTTKSVSENRLLLTINWNDYMRQMLKEIGKSTGKPMTQLNIDNDLENMKKRNMELIQNTIHDMLSKSNELSKHGCTYTYITLCPNTMSYEITRTHFINLARQINNQYNGVVELFHVGTNDKVNLNLTS